MGSLNFNHYQMGKFQNNFFFLESILIWFANFRKIAVINLFFCVQSRPKSCMCCSCTLFALFQKNMEGIIHFMQDHFFDGWEFIGAFAFFFFCCMLFFGGHTYSHRAMDDSEEKYPIGKL